MEFCFYPSALLPPPSLIHILLCIVELSRSYGSGAQGRWNIRDLTLQNVSSAVHEEKGLENAQLVVKGKDICV